MRVLKSDELEKLHRPVALASCQLVSVYCVRQEIVATAVAVQCFPQSLLTGLLGIAGLIAQGSAALFSFVGVPTIAMLSRGAPI